MKSQAVSTEAGKPARGQWTVSVVSVVGSVAGSKGDGVIIVGGNVVKNRDSLEIVLSNLSSHSLCKLAFSLPHSSCFILI